MKEANTSNIDGLKDFLPGIKDSKHPVPEHHFHAATGRMDKLRNIIEKYPYKVNEADSRGQVTLVWPIFTGQIDAVRYCLEMGADPFLKSHPEAASPMEAAETMRNVSEAHNECFELVKNAAQAILCKKTDGTSTKFTVNNVSMEMAPGY